MILCIFISICRIHNPTYSQLQLIDGHNCVVRSFGDVWGKLWILLLLQWQNWYSDEVGDGSWACRMFHLNTVCSRKKNPIHQPSPTNPMVGAEDSIQLAGCAASEGYVVVGQVVSKIHRPFLLYTVVLTKERDDCLTTYLTMFGRPDLLWLLMYGTDSVPSVYIFQSPAGSTGTVVDSAASLCRLGLPFFHSFASHLFDQLVEISAVGRPSSRQLAEGLCQTWQAQADPTWAMRDHG